jgi:hypothetical protein
MKFRLCIVFLRHGSGAQPHLFCRVAFELYHTQAQKAHFLARRKALWGGGFGPIVRRRAVILTGTAVRVEATRSALSNGLPRFAPGLPAAKRGKAATMSTIRFYRFYAAQMGVEIKLKVLPRRCRSAGVVARKSARKSAF